MSLFSRNDVGRITYLVVLLVMFCFDFAKAPIEKYVMRYQDALSISAFEPWREEVPATPPPLFEKSVPAQISTSRAQIDTNGPVFQMAGTMMAAQQKARAQGRELTEIETRAVALNALRSLPGNEHALEKTVMLAVGQTLTPLAAVVMTGITVVILLWMVTGRVRNIGWNQAVALGILALYFLPKVAGNSLPPAVLDYANPVFLCLMVFIGLVPPAGAGWFGPRQPPYDLYVPVRRARPGEFGKRGVQ